ncbi:hypothetical protein [Pseudomonas sp.]|uniref:hypothetical protein n=1 Tax=Pseudomonas sp. TaxID=306 RepID=UPI003CC630D7
MDYYLTIIVILFEFGLPFVLAYMALEKVEFRRVIVPVVGAVSPFLLVYIVGSITHILFPPDELSMFEAIFIMSFLPYLVFLAIGLALGMFLPKSMPLRSRYLVSFLTAPAVGLGLVVISW